MAAAMRRLANSGKVVAARESAAVQQQIIRAFITTAGGEHRQVSAAYDVLRRTAARASKGALPKTATPRFASSLPQVSSPLPTEVHAVRRSMGIRLCSSFDCRAHRMSNRMSVSKLTPRTWTQVRTVFSLNKPS